MRQRLGEVETRMALKAFGFCKRFRLSVTCHRFLRRPVVLRMWRLRCAMWRVFFVCSVSWWCARACLHWCVSVRFWFILSWLLVSVYFLVGSPLFFSRSSLLVPFLSLALSPLSLSLSFSLSFSPSLCLRFHLSCACMCPSVNVLLVICFFLPFLFSLLSENSRRPYK